jgi:hypothetical protein
MTFANPAAAWALLALLAVAAIHMLQRRRQRVLTSTLFLLEPAPLPAQGGRRLERLRRSTSLWLQLAAVTLLAFILGLPQRWREDSFQRVVVVLDSSVSMRAFRDRLESRVAARVRAEAGAAKRTEWIVLESAAGRRPLYRGAERAGVLDAVRAWEPREPTHDLAPAFEAARAAAGRDGTVLFVTDHEEPVPEGVARLAVGEPFDNVGWLNGDVDAAAQPPRWRALLRNHGRAAARRTFWVEDARGKSEPTAVELGPGEVKQLSGTLAAGQTALTLVLAPDAFDLDDRLPLIVPQPKMLRVRAEGPGTEAVVDRWAASLGAVSRGEPADVVLGVRAVPPAGTAEAGTGPATVEWLAAPPGRSTRLRDGAITAARHPLVEGLAWQGLLVPDVPGSPRAASDTVLVWQGERPLVFLRGPRHLHLDFPLEGTNALRLPALVVLLHRFLEDVRADLVREEHANVECGQRLALTAEAEAAPFRLVVDDDARLGQEAAEGLRAPWRPAHFRVTQGAMAVFTGAAHFSDLREADFTSATSSELTPAAPRETRERQRRDDPWLPLWIVLLGATVVADWARQERRA